MIGEQVVFSVDGLGSLTFGDSRPLYCESFEATTVSSKANTNTAIGVDGQTASNITLEPQAIRCKFAIFATCEDGKRHDFEKLRSLEQEIIRIFNPHYIGTLIRVNKNGTYKISARVSETPIFEPIAGASCRFSVTFIADRPVWQGMKVKEYALTAPGSVTIYNTFGEELPLVIRGTVPANSVFTIENLSSGKKIALRQLNRSHDMSFALDTDTCRMLAQRSEGGPLESANFVFTADSDLDITLLNGENILNYSVSGDFYEEAEKAITLATCDRYVGVT